MLKNTTGFNKKLLMTYFISHFVRRQLYIVFIGFALVLAIGLVIMQDFSNIGYLLLTELIYLLVISLIFGLLIRAQVNRGMHKGILRLHYEFLEDQVRVSSVINGEEVNMNFFYTEVKKIVRYQYVVMFYFSYNEALLMDANGFTVGNYQDFKPFILDKLKLSKK